MDTLPLSYKISHLNFTDAEFELLFENRMVATAFETHLIVSVDVGAGGGGGSLTKSTFPKIIPFTNHKQIIHKSDSLSQTLSRRN